ncbi:MAG: apolipoprotein N-acyltransferase, partial [Magnetococcales bacterium]|nr:apolipoprotein N-acyltransferase [Magnetococcales bacterium]
MPDLLVRFRSSATSENLLALLAGGATMWGLPPEAHPVPAILGMGVLLRLLDGSPSRRGARLGFLFGLGHFIPGLAWLWSSLHVFGKIPAPVVVGMIVGLAAILSGYCALFGALLPRLVPARWLLPLAAAALWVVTEWLRAHLFSGFPWNLLGQVWDGSETCLQLADLGGVYLLSGLTLFLAGLLALAVPVGAGQGFRTPAVALVVALGVLGAGYGYGHWRLETLAADSGMLRVALVQGNVPQDLKWDPERKKDWLKRYLEHTRALEKPVDLVVWPETAVGFFLQISPEELARITTLSREINAPILTGAPMADRDGQNEWSYFNSMILIDSGETGKFASRYDKHHLVPYGEYIPFRSLAPASMHKLTHGSKDFSTGPGPVTLNWGLDKIGPLICYEVIFPDEVRQLAV